MVQYITAPATITINVTMTAGYPAPEVSLILYANAVEIGRRTMTIPKGTTDSLVVQIPDFGEYAITAHAVASNPFGSAEGDSAPIELVVGEAPTIAWG